jgi:hypothetical protein
VAPSDLRALAEQQDQQGLEAARAGDTHTAASAFLEALNLRRTADELESRLRQAPRRVTTPAVVTADRLQRSASAEGGDDALAQAARAAGMTVRALAQAVRREMAGTAGFRGCSHVTLMRARRREATVWRPVAEVIERLTGFGATRKNWPGGIRG